MRESGSRSRKKRQHTGGKEQKAQKQPGVHTVNRNGFTSEKDPSNKRQSEQGVGTFSEVNLGPRDKIPRQGLELHEYKNDNSKTTTEYCKTIKHQGTSIAKSSSLIKHKSRKVTASDPDLPDHLSCCVCLELFRKPVLLECTHTVCQKCAVCLTERIRGAGLCVRCPMCRSVSRTSLITRHVTVESRVQAYQLQHGLVIDDTSRDKQFCDDDMFWCVKANQSTPWKNSTVLNVLAIFGMLTVVSWIMLVPHSEASSGQAHWLSASSYQLLRDVLYVIYTVSYGITLLVSISVLFIFFGTLYFVFSYFINATIQCFYYFMNIVGRSLKRVCSALHR